MDDTQGAGLEFNRQVLALCGNAKSSLLLRVCTIHLAPLPYSGYWAAPAQLKIGPFGPSVRKKWCSLFWILLNCCVVQGLNKLQTQWKKYLFFPILNKRKQCAIHFVHQVTENFQEESIILRNHNSHMCTKIYIGTQVKELRSIFTIRIKSAL